MTITKKADSPFYYTRFTVNGRRIQESTKTTCKETAQRFEACLKKQMYDEAFFGLKPKMTWIEAKERWIREKAHKRTIGQDIKKFNDLSKFDRLCLTDITSDRIEQLAIAKEATGVKPATINRILALLKSILIAARDRWEVIDRVPHIRMRTEPKFRDSWLTPEKVSILSAELIRRGLHHTNKAMWFTIWTGARKSNAATLEWPQVDLTEGKEYLYIKSTDFKNNTNFCIPLNAKAISILQDLLGQHPSRVFTYDGKPIQTFNTRAWRNALKAVGLEGFTWHDLRHTFATWFLIAGGTLHELMGLGGWKDIKSVMKYSHWAHEYLRKASNKIIGEFA